MTNLDIHRFASLRSTNTEMAAQAAALPHGAVFVTDDQTAGRGQRGNSWEAAPNQNLTFSVLLRPRSIVPVEAFAISMLTSLSIADALEPHLPGRRVMIKWPNDIYVDDLKLCGILIENAFYGSTIGTSIIGIGINVNQTEFLSDAPNPVSMAKLSGATFSLPQLLEEVCQKIVDDFDAYESAPDLQTLTATYRARQWRGSGVYKWRDVLCDEVIEASILSVAPSGILTLNTNPPRSYAFKELQAIL